MASSAHDIPSTAYKPQSIGGGLDPVTVIRSAKSDSEVSGEGHRPAGTSTLARLFPAEDQRREQADLPAGLKLGDYVIESRIGAGGMGAVFKGRDERLDRLVALKILAPAQTGDPSSVKRFQNEARAAARLDHDNIARIYAIGESQGLHYIAFEYVEGITVRELIRQRGVVDPHETVNFMLQISVALKHTAAAGVVHRDIKPSNLILTPQGRAKLVDWGLARKERLDDNSVDLTVSGTTLGTFDYISPEQARDPRNVDVRSDIYSLGCTSYHMLTGSPPYAEGTVLQKLLDHQGKSAPDPRDKNPNVPRELSRIVRKMMASDPGDRYWSPQALTHDLLVLAAETGLKPVHPDGLTWRTQSEQSRSRFPQELFWWWLGAFSLACVGGILADRWMLSQDSSLESAIPSMHAGDGVDWASEFPFMRPLPSGQITNRVPVDPAASDRELLKVFPDRGLGSELFPNSLDMTDQLIVPDGLPKPLTSLGTSVRNGTEEKLAWVYQPALTDGWGDQNFPEKQPGMVGIDIQEELSLGRASTSGTAVTPSSPAARSRSPQSPLRILAANGELIQSAADLESALAAVPDGGVIELPPPVNGQILRVRQLKVIDKSITIRTAGDVATILRFDTALIGSEIRASEFVSINGGSLTLTNLHLQVTVKTPLAQQAWSLFGIEGTGRLRCRQTTVTVESQYQTNASVVKFNRSPLQSVDAMNIGLSDGEFRRRVQFDDCVIRGAVDLIAAETSDASALELTRSLITIDGALVRYTGDNNARMQMENFDVRLSRVAAVINNGIVAGELGVTVPRQPVQFQLRSDDSIFLGQIDQPFIQLAGAMETRTLQGLVFWSGDHNLYGGWKNYLSIRGLPTMDSSPVTVGYESWIQAGGQIQESSSRLLKNALPAGEGTSRFDQWTARKFLSILQAENGPSVVEAELSDYGPDFFDLPVPPPLIDDAPLSPPTAK